MQHPHIVKSPCPKCSCPLIVVNTYCCSDTADIECRKCGYTAEMPASVEVPDSEARVLLRTCHVATNGLGQFIFTKRVPYTEREAVERFGVLTKGMPKEPGYVAFLIADGESEALDRDERSQMEDLMKKHGYWDLDGPRIGFAGRTQVIDPPMRTVPIAGVQRGN